MFTCKVWLVINFSQYFHRPTMSLRTCKFLEKITTCAQKRRRLATAVHLKDRGDLIINCRRQQYNFYSDDFYSKLDELPLASKGWNHSKSKGDYFIVRPVKGEERPQDLRSFRDADIHTDLIKRLNELSIKEATGFQVEGIKAVRDCHHLILAAETGCGKTLTYLLPIIDALIGPQVGRKARGLNSPRALVIVPNRELAHQVGEVTKQLGEPFDLHVKTVVGGRTKKMMLNPELSEVDVLVATPGALGKLSSVGIFKLDDVLYTVLDEADTLLDDSFEERLTSIIRRVSQSKIILVSATLPKTLPVALKPIEEDLRQVVSPKLHRPLLNITQKFLRMTQSNKPGYLLESARKNKHPMIVFSNKSQTCDWVAMFLREHEMPCANINGNMNYAIRMQQWDDFVSGKTRILSATDIGSRGLNTTQIHHVINYDFPLYPADYIHRVGRTGRFGSPEACRVTNFISGPLEVKLVQQIEMAIRRRLPLENVDGNITSLVQDKIIKQMQEVA